MKKIISTLIIVFGLTFAGTMQAQNFNDVYRKYKKEQGITGVRINKFGCMLASLFVDDDDDARKFVRKSSGIRILVNENGNSKALTEDVYKYIRKGNLEQLISVQDEEDLVDIYILEKKQTIYQLLIIVSDDEDQIVVCLDGKYPLKMIQEAIAGEDGISVKKMAKKM